jgi:hypothetical protein
VLTTVDWTSPQVARTVIQLWQTVSGRDPASVRERAMEERLSRLEELSAKLVPASTPAAPSQSPVSTVDLSGVIEQVTVISGDLKEALRFAREDGLSHPEVVRRVAHAQEVADTLERFTLRPEVLATLAPDQRKVLEQQVLPHL